MSDTVLIRALEGLAGRLDEKATGLWEEVSWLRTCVMALKDPTPSSEGKAQESSPPFSEIQALEDMATRQQAHRQAIWDKQYSQSMKTLEASRRASSSGEASGYSGLPIVPSQTGRCPTCGQSMVAKVGTEPT